MSTQTTESFQTKKCRPCEGGVEKLSHQEAVDNLRLLTGWRISQDGLRLEKEWLVKSFKAGIDFINRVAEIAEERRPSSRDPLDRFPARLDRDLDPRRGRAHGERLHPRRQDRLAADRVEGARSTSRRQFDFRLADEFGPQAADLLLATPASRPGCGGHSSPMSASRRSRSSPRAKSRAACCSTSSRHSAAQASKLRFCRTSFSYCWDNWPRSCSSSSFF